MSLKLYTEVEMMIWQAYPIATDQNFKLDPRFLGFGFYETPNKNILPWRGSRPPGFLFSGGGGSNARFWTAHIVTFTNIPNDDRVRHFPCLSQAPTITESLPSLTSSMTDFGGISISLSDPDVRKFFAIGISETSTQNFVNIYRSVCGIRALVWRGYMDGVGFGQDRSTQIQARPVTKRFGRLATFGFDNKIPDWKDNEFKIPIVAARIIPWSVQSNDHSPVGAETFTQFTRTNETQFRGKDQGLVVNYQPNSRLIYAPFDYGTRLMTGQIAKQKIDAIKNKDDSSLSDTQKNADNRRVETQSEFRNAFNDHLQFKSPQYVSFDPNELVPTIVEMRQGGEISFKRGIFFVPSEDEDVSDNFDPREDNYRMSPIPKGADTSRYLNLVSASHLERFMLGSEWITEIDIRGISGFTKIAPMLAKTGVSLPFTWQDSGGTRVRAVRQNLNFKGFDQTAIFPSLRLGDSYCNWTQIPTLFQGENRPEGTYPFPPEDDSFFIQPAVQYMITESGQLVRSTNRSPHPLDSFYRWTLQANKPSSPVGAYLRACIYTPHAVALSYLDYTNVSQSIYRLRGTVYGDPTGYLLESFNLSSEIGYLDTRTDKTDGFIFQNNSYTFTQWATFTTIQGGQLGKRAHINELSRFVKGYSSSISPAPPGRLRISSFYLNPNGVESNASQTQLYNGRDPVSMARSKDMYATLPHFDRFQNINQDYLANNLFEKQVEIKHQAGATSNLRVMPALPKSSIFDHDYPIITTERAPLGGGAYYVESSYGIMDEVGYWDSSSLLNPGVIEDQEEGRVFKGYYHHDQFEPSQGVSPANFILAVVRAAGFETNIDFNLLRNEMQGSINPMQFISDSDSTYQSLLDRVLPGLGKGLRFDPIENIVELFDWHVAHPTRDFDRGITAFFDENCMRFEGVDHSAASRSSVFIFENPDMLRGNNTLDEFSDEHFQLAKYTSFQSNPFVQGKTVTIPTGTWWNRPQTGLRFYEDLAEILTQRVDIVSFSVPSEVLLGLGPLGTVSVGKWVRLQNESLVGGIADIFITETQQEEVETRFRGYRFADIGIQNPEDNNITPPSIPLENDLFGEVTVGLNDLQQAERDAGVASFSIGGIFTPYFLGVPVAGIAASNSNGLISRGQNAIFNISVVGDFPEDRDEITVKYIVSSGGRLVSDSELGEQEVTIRRQSPRASISIPTIRSGPSQIGYFVKVRLLRGIGYQLGLSQFDTLEEEPPEAAVVPEVSVRTQISSISEGQQARWTVSLSERIDRPLTVFYTISENGDFVRSSDLGRKTLIFRANDSTENIIARTINDTVVESNGSVTLTLNPGTGYTVNSSRGSAVIRVRSDDVRRAMRGDELGNLQTILILNDNIKSYRGMAAYIRSGNRFLQFFSLKGEDHYQITNLRNENLYDTALETSSFSRQSWIPNTSEVLGASASANFVWVLSDLNKYFTHLRTGDRQLGTVSDGRGGISRRYAYGSKVGFYGFPINNSSIGQASRYTHISVDSGQSWIISGLSTGISASQSQGADQFFWYAMAFQTSDEGSGSASFYALGRGNRIGSSTIKIWFIAEIQQNGIWVNTFALPYVAQWTGMCDFLDDYLICLDNTNDRLVWMYIPGETESSQYGRIELPSGNWSAVAQYSTDIIAVLEDTATGRTPRVRFFRLDDE